MLSLGLKLLQVWCALPSVADLAGTPDESMLVTKPSFGVVVVEDNQSDRRLSDSAYADESDGCQIFCQINDLNQLATSETCPWCRGR